MQKNKRNSYLRKEEGLKICSKCKIEQLVIDFYSDKHNIDGLKSICKKCELTYSYKYRNSDPIQRLYMNARSGANARKLNFNILKSDLIIPEKCPILGLNLIFSNKVTRNTPSIDRIDSNIGYEKNNIIVCSYRVNRLKGDASIGEMKLIYNNWKSISNNFSKDDYSYNIERMISHCKSRCKVSGIVFNISEKDINIPIICPVL